MEEAIHHWMQQAPFFVLLIIIGVALFVVGKGADVLVDQAVHLSHHWGVPTAVVGATIVSLGTTTPEAAISVLAAFQGAPDLALGNAVGSIICDTGLILGIAILIQPLPLDKKVVNRQGWLQFGAGVLLVVACLPFFGGLHPETQMPLSIGGVFESGGVLVQPMGFVFLALLAGYMWISIKWSRGGHAEESPSGELNGVAVFSKLLLAIVIVVASSWILVPAVREAALRMNVPTAIVAATMVAFGTSLPELVTAVTAARKGHGELALGNVVGADILNVLFVAGASAAVTKGGLYAPSNFFMVLFPAMLFVLIVFRVGIMISGTHMKRPVGFLLIGAYLVATAMGYIAK